MSHMDTILPADAVTGSTGLCRPPPPSFATSTGVMGGMGGALGRSASMSWMPFDLCGSGHQLTPRTPLSPRTRSSSAVCGMGNVAASTSPGGGASRVADFLYVGSLHDALNTDFLARRRITRIINLSGASYWTHGDVKVKQFRIDDTADAPIEKLFMPCAAMINDARREWAEGKSTAMLIHCQQGRSRSVTIAAAYFIIYNGWTVAEALTWLTRCRPCTEPNLGFVEALRTLQEKLTDNRRSAARGRLCAVVRAKTPPEAVEAVLSAQVGMVWQVVQYEAPRTPPPRMEGNPDVQEGSEGSQLLVVFFVCTESVAAAVKLSTSKSGRLASQGIERITSYVRRRVAN